jgi:nitroimidazol reductase NimA-like FMN-containing flavoprotein (pyridoxamine 5'-phosphate oxidase superfamily)
MRKKNRQIMDINEIIKIIDKCDCCRLAFFDKDYPYIIPLNFGYNYKNSKLYLYFHGANEGKKLDLIKNNKNVAFEMDIAINLVKGSLPCNYTMEYESVCGNGKIEVVNNQEKIEGLKYLMKHYSDKKYKDTDFSKKQLSLTRVLKLKVNTIEAKRLKRK